MIVSAAQPEIVPDPFYESGRRMSRRCRPSINMAMLQIQSSSHSWAPFHSSNNHAWPKRARLLFWLATAYMGTSNSFLEPCLDRSVGLQFSLHR